MNLLEFVLDNNYFIVDGTFYKQIFCCPMGSPVSAILANLVMEHVEEIAEMPLSFATFTCSSQIIYARHNNLHV